MCSARCACCACRAQADTYIKRLLNAGKPPPAAAAGKDGQPPGAAATGSDAYGQLAYGNLLLASAPSDRRKDADARRAENNLYKVRLARAF